MRNLATEDEDEIRKTTQQLEMFENEIEELQKQIEDFDSQNDANSLDHTKQKCSKLASEKIEKEERMGKIQPDLDRLKKALDDQERHKKNLNENINLIGLSSRIREIEKEIQSLQEAAANVAGHETAYDDARRLRDRETEIAQMNARLEGRRGEIYENVRSFKVCMAHLHCFLVGAVDKVGDLLNSFRIDLTEKAISAGVQKCRGRTSSRIDKKRNYADGSQRYRQVPFRPR